MSYDPHTSVDRPTRAWEHCGPPTKLSGAAAAPPPAIVSFNREDVESVASLRSMSPRAASDGVTLFNFFPQKSDNHVSVIALLLTDDLFLPAVSLPLPDIVCPVFFLNSPTKNFIWVSPGVVRLPLVTPLC